MGFKNTSKLLLKLIQYTGLNYNEVKKIMLKNEKIYINKIYNKLR